jgi:hypothetical protein
MDPGSRPALEPLPDLSVETPLDAASSRPDARRAPAASRPTGPDDEEAQALAFMDPELQLSPSQAAPRPAQSAAVVIPVPAGSRANGGEYRSIDESLEQFNVMPKAPSVVPSSRPELTLEEIDAAAQAAAATPKPAPAASSAATPSPAPTSSPALPELTLEDREVDRVLASGAPLADLAPVIPVPATSAPAATPPAATPAATPPAKAAAPKPRAPAAAAPPGAARGADPVASPDSGAKSDSAAKRASLSAAATKLAAASAASAGRNGKASAPVAPAAPVRAPAAATGAGASGAAAPSASPVSAPSLTDWASARAAAATKVVSTPAAPAPRTPTPPTLSAAAPALASTTPPSAPPAAAAGAAAPQTAPSAPMDRDFIARNQVVERYLSGRLPLKGATEFERYCHDHPELLDEIGLAERVNAGLRLLEASGKPEPWQESPRPGWQQPIVTLGLAAGVVVLVIALVIASGNSAGKSHRIADLQKQMADRTTDPATSTREIRLLPSRSGASNSPAITIGGGEAQLADFRIDESRSPYHLFRVTIDRVDEGRVSVINNLAKDSNGHLRIALNSSVLGPGIYQLTLEGLDWHGDPQPDSWVTIGVQH